MKTVSRQEFVDMVADKLGNRYPKLDLHYIIRDTFSCLEETVTVLK